MTLPGGNSFGTSTLEKASPDAGSCSYLGSTPSIGEMVASSPRRVVSVSRDSVELTTTEAPEMNLRRVPSRRIEGAVPREVDVS